MKQNWMNTEKALSYLRGGSTERRRKKIKYLDVERIREKGRAGNFGYIKDIESPYGEALVETNSAYIYFRSNLPKDRAPHPKVKITASLLKEDGYGDEELADIFNEIRNHHKKWSVDDIRRLRKRGPNPTRR